MYCKAEKKNKKADSRVSEISERKFGGNPFSPALFRLVYDVYENAGILRKTFCRYQGVRNVQAGNVMVFLSTPYLFFPALYLYFTANQRTP